MKDRVKDMFEQVTMPEATEEKIRQAMTEGRKPSRRIFRNIARPAAILAAMLALILAISPTARAAVSDWVLKYVFPESGISIYEQTDENGDVIGIVAVDTEAPPFAEVRNGRLYFTGNGEEIDITDQITEEKPYYYTYVDDYGLTHFLVVGYSGTIDNFGIYEFMREEKEGQQDWEGWSNGTGRNFLDPETETRYPWVDAVWEDLNIPWPKPG